MLLNEVFNAPTEWEAHEQRLDYFEAWFRIRTMPYRFRASAYIDKNDEMVHPTHWDVEFYADVDIRTHDKYGVLNIGNQQQVFATVVDIMKTFVKQYRPAIISFQAEEPSRMKLYQRMVSRLLPDWKMTQVGKEITVHNPATR